MKILFNFTFLCIISIGNLMCQDNIEIPNNRANPISLVYKVINNDTLELILLYPDEFQPTEIYPTIIFFFGGGWNGGSVEQFRPHAEYLSSRGMLAVLADYRVKSRHGTTPFEAVSDAKSALRFLRQYAEALNVDPNKIVASGGSAGGHLAAACGTLNGLNQADEDLSISSKPNALVLFNPVFDNGPDGFEHERMGTAWQEISPAHNITAGVPPTIIFLGTKDHLIPVAIANNFKSIMEAHGNRCALFLYEEQGHGFFNKSKNDGIYFQKTVYETDVFLHSLGYIKGSPKL